MQAIKPVHVRLCIPTSGHPHWRFTESLLMLVSRFIKVDPLMPVAMSHEFIEGSLLPKSRRLLVEHALAFDDPDVGPVTHILFLDDDMAFPPETFQRLLEHGKPIVACNYPTRRFPVHMTAQKDGKPISSAGKHSVEKVNHAGMGVMLVDIEVFKAIPKPWFMVGWWSNEAGEGEISEDAFFCMKARTHGFDTWVNHDLSQEVSHFGGIEFTHHEAESEARLEAAE